jgi:hypothetical protein
MPVFQQRRGTAAAMAAANEVPAAGQIYYETDTNRIKIGNGTTAYNSLPYLGLSDDIEIGDVQGLVAALQAKAALVHNHVVADILDAGSAATKNAPVSGDATAMQVVLGSDSRLTNQREPLDGSVTSPKLAPSLVLDGGTF